MATFSHEPKASGKGAPAIRSMPDAAHLEPERGPSWTPNALGRLEDGAVNPRRGAQRAEREWTFGPPADGRYSHDLSRIQIHQKSPARLQAELTVNEPGDVHEQEADRVAEEVMGRSNPQRSNAAPGDSAYYDGGHTPRSMTGVQPGDPEKLGAPSVVQALVSSPGEPLTRETRGWVEPRFGHDFSAVRVHSGGPAGQSAEELGAQAYTVGHHVVFGAGRYAPGTAAGQRLLAHELTHVVQQNGAATALQRAPKPDAGGKQDVAAARQRAKALAEKIKQEGKLSDTAKAKMVADLNFFEGDAWKTYGDTIRPALQAVVKNDKNDKAEKSEEMSEMRKTYPGAAALAEVFTETFAPGVTMQDAKSAVHILRIASDDVVLTQARADFRAKHGGHGKTVLDNIDEALQRITRNNPTLLVAYYRYYAGHELTDSLPWNMSNDTYTGATAHGDSDINPHVLAKDSKFPTDDPVSLLGSTLIHEYSHTPQDNPNNEQYEAKAYGIEYFLSERAGDKRRAEFISNNRIAGYGSGLRRIAYRSYYVLQELYKTIDQGGREAIIARDMSVEYISKNPGDYRPELKALYAKVSEYYVP